MDVVATDFRIYRLHQGDYTVVAPCGLEYSIWLRRPGYWVGTRFDAGDYFAYGLCNLESALRCIKAHYAHRRRKAL
jgi:hypothetical protein